MTYIYSILILSMLYMLHKIGRSSLGDAYHTRGFIALLSIIVLSLGALAFTLVANMSAITYLDSVYRREWRIQADFNAQACVDAIILMSIKDIFLEGEVRLRDFGCIASIKRDLSNNISADIQIDLMGIHRWRDINI